MNDRDCANCGNRSDRGCKVWECEFKPVFSESKQPIIEELEKIKVEIIKSCNNIAQEVSDLSYTRKIYVFEQLTEIKGAIDNHISELKGKQE